MSRSAVDAVWRERRLAAMRAEVEASHDADPPHSHGRRGYDPNQPRVPKGYPDGGQWTSTGAGESIRLAATDWPLGPQYLRQVIRRALRVYRSENLLRDLFGRKQGAVTYTRFDGEDIFGSNSRSPMYTKADKDAATQLRDRMLPKYPDLLKQDDIGQMPNDAFFHAETTVLLRAHKKAGGTLAGRTIRVYGDRELCPSCEKVLPKIGLELGNPTVFFDDDTGRIFMIKDGKGEWLP
jgi:hypothetical protein